MREDWKGSTVLRTPQRITKTTMERGEGDKSSANLVQFLLSASKSTKLLFRNLTFGEITSAWKEFKIVS